MSGLMELIHALHKRGDLLSRSAAEALWELRAAATTLAAVEADNERWRNGWGKGVHGLLADLGVAPPDIDDVRSVEVLRERVETLLDEIDRLRMELQRAKDTAMRLSELAAEKRDENERLRTEGAATLQHALSSAERLQAENERLRGHLEDIAADARRDALEEAAQKCQDMAETYRLFAAQVLADAIRALKEKRDG